MRLSILLTIILCTTSIRESESRSYCIQHSTTSIWYDKGRCTLNKQVKNGRITQYKRECPTIPSCMPDKTQMKDCCPYCPDSDVIPDIYHLHENSDYKNHPCVRRCVRGQTMICQYTFTISEHETSSSACFDCPFNKVDCYRKNCVPAVGVSRLVILVNKMFPGPDIQVCEGDTVVVNVRNELLSQSISIHWHGITQRNTQYSDGVPFLTQCPIRKRNSFRYVFKADSVGTHFYHSHTGVQMTDGCVGPLIIRQVESKNALRNLYDFDLHEHIIQIQDWSFLITEDIFTRRFYMLDPLVPDALVINGKGRLFPESLVPLETSANTTKLAYDKLSKMPFAEFIVRPGKRYRFRIINSGSYICPISISIDNHDLTVIATDGNDVEPTPVNWIITDNGERYDVIVNANQPVDKYWIRISALRECIPNQSYQFAILRYVGSTHGEPNQPKQYVKPQGVRLGSLARVVSEPQDLQLSDLRSIEIKDKGLFTKDPDYKFYVELSELKVPLRIVTPYPGPPPVEAVQLNHITLRLPPFNLLTHPFDPPSAFCNDTSMKERNCTTEVCECLHVLEVRLNSIVEIIMFFTGYELARTDHPMHLHGYSFVVLAQESVYNMTKEKLQQMDANGELHRNFNYPVIKDTVVVYSPGYTIIRFNASNPGFWLLHCHQQFHIIQGMSLVLKVGGGHDLPPVPTNLPTCGNYQPP